MCILMYIYISIFLSLFISSNKNAQPTIQPSIKLSNYTFSTNSETNYLKVTSQLATKLTQKPTKTIFNEPIRPTRFQILSYTQYNETIPKSTHQKHSLV